MSKVKKYIIKSLNVIRFKELFISVQFHENKRISLLSLHVVDMYVTFQNKMQKKMYWPDFSLYFSEKQTKISLS